MAAVLEMSRIVSREQLDTALVRRKTMSHLRLGDALVQEKVITTAQRDAALAMQVGDRRRLLGEILVESGAATREEVRRVLSEQLGVPSVNLAKFQSDANAIEAIGAELARKHTVIPLYRSTTRLAVAIENPLSWEALQELETVTGLKVDPAMAKLEDLLAAIAQHYPTQASGPQALPRRAIGIPGGADAAQGALLRLALRMIEEACSGGRLDVQVESVPGEAARVRVRVEGIVGA